jgi:hypothetical protein
MFFTIMILKKNPNDVEASGNLNGQCHEMVVEIRQWSGRLCLN